MGGMTTPEAGLTQGREAKRGPLTEAMVDRASTKRVMVVEDDVGAMTLLRIMLERAGFTVVAARDALSALDMLEGATPDLFVLDVMMPSMDGFELCRQIRARPQTADTPIIILSARHDHESVAEGLAGGANDYLVKPILHHDLTAKVWDLLGS